MFRCICMEIKRLEMCIVLSRPDEANWQLVELAASPWYLVFVKILKFICMNLKSICLEIEIVVKCIGAKQVRCRRLATGRAGRLSLAPKPPAAPTHSLGFYSPPGFAQIFYFQISISLHFYISALHAVMPWKSHFWEHYLFILWEAYCVHWCLYESQYVILMILSDCPTDTYIGDSSFRLVFLMEPRPLFIRVRDGSVCFTMSSDESVRNSFRHKVPLLVRSIHVIQLWYISLSYA